MRYSLLIIWVLCSAAACASSHPVALTEDLTPNADEKMIWRRAQEEQDVLDNSGLLYRDPELENYLNQIAGKLQRHAIPTDISFHIKVIQDPNLNAFAFPNGTVYVHTGILARMDNEAQLAALLAHEMTHSTHRHALRVLKSIKDPPKVVASLQESMAGIPVFQDLAHLLGAAGSMAAVSGYSREFETEADRVGLDLTAKAGYDSKQALDLFEHLRQEIEIEGIKEPFFFGTHPSVEQRIENVSNWLSTEIQGSDAGIKNTAAFNSKMHRVILDNARLDLRRGRYNAAQRGVEKYLRTHSDDAYAYYLLGEIFRQRGRPEDSKAAITYYENAIALDPKFPEPLKAMGLLHYKKGQMRLAKKFFESCLLLAPDTADKEYIRGYLKICARDGEKS